MLPSQEPPTLLSPPVTPKIDWKKERVPPTDEMLLPPTVSHLARPSAGRKSVARRFNRAKALVTDRDCFVHPFHATAATRRSGRTKTIPRRSPPPTTHGCFTMDVFAPIVRDESVSPDANSPCFLPSLSPPPMPQPATATMARRMVPTKKPKTDAATATYDNVDLSMVDSCVFDDPAWIPDTDIFEKKPNVRVVWKGSPLFIDHMPYYECLHPSEVTIASTLRLTPEQYLKCRRALVLSAQEFDRQDMTFRKSDAQKVCRIDVNKTSTLWCVFHRLGWFTPQRF